MKLWLLKATDKAEELGKQSWDSYDSFVIREETEQNARLRASTEAADEGADTWLNPELSTCKELIGKGKPEIVIGSFNAGQLEVKKENDNT